ncbi:hypothetical protein [Glaciecola sp. SC05]|uniref:hypothetical protein n=1 Tax=Glaciecola sp. SC05 TaxID=1987355 RepID=UPI0035298A96
MKQKARTINLNIDPQNLFEFDGLALDFNTQTIMGVKKGENHPLIGQSKLGFSRYRQSKAPKILHESISPSDQTWFDSNHQLLAYDHLIAVDTNTNSIAGSHVSITAAFHVIPQINENGEAQCMVAVIALLEFWNVSAKQENLGWFTILNMILAHQSFFPGKIALIVDSDLGNHDAFNNREIPIYNDMYLPSNVTISYASDKGGPEHLSTKLIKHCHNLASDLYKNGSLLLKKQGLVSIENEVYSHFRQWDIEKSSLRAFVSNDGRSQSTQGTKFVPLVE